MKVIHVAGTNGKGSVCAMLSAILQAAGYKVGLFTSPHLLRLTERIVINGVEISEREFNKSLAYIKSIYPPESHFFEWYTCMAYDYFAKQKVDFAIMETGVGGRLDPTNAVNKPILAVITSIGYDHQEILGSTLEQIAYEKAGIIKENCPVVLPVQNAHKLIQAAKEKNATRYMGSDVYIENVKSNISGTSFSVKTQGLKYENVSLPLLGKHQIDNAVTVLLSVQALRDKNVRIPDEAVYAGLKNTRWPGRFEILPGKPFVVVDGAHNINGAESFSQAIDLYFNQPIILIVGMVREKDISRILNVLISCAKHIICTQPPVSRALPAEDLAAKISGKPVDAIPSPLKALEKAKSFGSSNVIGITGSLYLIGEFLDKQG